MLSGCPDCIDDETERGENALHLAVMNNRFEAVKKMVGWIREMNKEFLLNMKDEQGNTVLHLASWKKQRRVIEILLGK
ncbi:HOMEOBOX PROTEIN WARIAI [Salix koriyanagi]|uniref:HOMEOBOX PROTEIN WARIAI n=1 Tax=Salix koriyanagi TaxID=2511006 RepID=A0A9Q1AAT2_9ROSI|nr:HOMEOBOX PROTEIN WARIAI [Salix koriyanagi]